MTLSRTGKQLVGAAIGMTIATVVYMGIDQLSMTSSGMKAYLVSPGQNISENAGQVRVNDTTTDSTTLSRLGRLASTVAHQLNVNEGLHIATPATTPMNERVTARKQERVVEADRVTALENAVEYPGTQTVVDQSQRLALRAARVVAAQSTHAGAPTYVPNPALTQVATTPVQLSTPTVVAQVTMEQPPTMHVTNDLPDSGLGINLLLVISLIASLLMIRPDFRQRLIASLRHSF